MLHALLLPSIISSSYEDVFDSASSIPSVLNIDKKDALAEIVLLAPGWKAEDFKLKMEDGLLIVEASKEDRVEDQEDNYTLREFNCRLFSWTYRINKPVHDLHMVYQNDKLHISYKL